MLAVSISPDQTKFTLANSINTYAKPQGAVGMHENPHVICHVIYRTYLYAH